MAGAGQKVAKHGNYGASSISRANNVMGQLGYKFSNDNNKLKKEIEEAGFVSACPVISPCFKNSRTDQEKPGDAHLLQYAGAYGEPRFTFISVSGCLQPGDGKNIQLPVAIGRQTFWLFTAWMDTMKYRWRMIRKWSPMKAKG